MSAVLYPRTEAFALNHDTAATMNHTIFSGYHGRPVLLLLPFVRLVAAARV
jgi:hypothetical protein